jgi:two-component system, NarL family, competent response regulator ComA
MGNDALIDKQLFTKKQLAVIEQLLEGKSNKQIALQLGITTRAVEYHLSQIYEKLGVSHRIEAIIRLARLFQK